MVVGQIKDMIADGHLKVGEQIPSESELSEFFSVGRTTIREAVKALCLIGVLKRSNKGTFVNSNIPLFNSEPLTYKLLLQSDTKSDVYEARLALEGEIAALAALRATEEDILRLSNAIKKAEEVKGSENIKEIFDADMDFHIALANAANNSVLFELYSVIYEIMVRGHDKFHILWEKEDFQDWGIENHKKILEAIKQGKAEEARQLARKPLLEIVEKLRESLMENTAIDGL